MLTMNPRHPRWIEFLTRLEGPEGCNFQAGSEGQAGGSTWLCFGGRNKEKALKILESMDGINIPASLRYFERKGGFCDCQILFNVAYAP